MLDGRIILPASWAAGAGNSGVFRGTHRISGLRASDKTRAARTCVSPLACYFELGREPKDGDRCSSVFRQPRLLHAAADNLGSRSICRAEASYPGAEPLHHIKTET